MTPPMEFAALFQPVSPKRFEREFWGRRGLLVHGPVGRLGTLAGFAAAFDPIGTILGSRRAVAVSYPRAWLRGRGAGPTHEEFHSDEAMVLFRLGATVVVRGQEDFDPRIDGLLAAVRVAVDATDAVVSDLVLGGGEAFAPMTLGTGPRLLIGLRGQQRWRTSARLVDATELRAEPVSQPLVLEQGTVAYVPRGEIRALDANAGSATLAVAMPEASSTESALQAFVDRLQREPSLRAPALLPPTSSGRSHALRAAGEALRAVPLALAGWSAAAALAQRAGPSYARRPGAKGRVRSSSARRPTFIIFDGARTREVPIDTSLAPVCRWIATRRSWFSRRQLQVAFSLDDELVGAVLDTCVAAGLLDSRAADG